MANTIKQKEPKSKNYADSIRRTYNIPELAYAVVSADHIVEIQTLGFQRIGTVFKAKKDDRFHIGSNTKAITAFIAAKLIKEKKLSWNTKFFGLFPELKSKSKQVYYNITLADLLSFRGKLPSYTYTFQNPTKEQIIGTEEEQRYQLAEYFIGQDPMKEEDGLTASNVDYILAGLMLEKASGLPYKILVGNLGKSLGISFYFDYPNLKDSLQPWGHDAEMKPIPPAKQYKLNWLLSAGNINLSLRDYVKFIQLQLRGLKGNESTWSKKEFDYLLFGMPIFSMGSFNKIDQTSGNTIAYNTGNAGAFITEVQIVKEKDMAYIVFTNSSSEQTSKSIEVLINHLEAIY